MDNHLSNLKEKLSGELYFNASVKDQSMLHIYATDASEYQEKPIGVALPKTINDIKLLIAFAINQKISLIPRAAGTSLAGQVVGAGLVVDISKYFNKIIEVNAQDKWVRVQPGVIRDDLNVALKTHGLMFGPETSTANRAMIGGMIGNNSCGLHSIIWGTTRDNLLEVNALLADGTEVVFGEITEADLLKKTQSNTLEGKIYRELMALLDNEDNKKAIKEGFPHPDIKRRNTGYALDAILEQQPTRKINLAKLIAGSEGTLCLVTEAKLQLIELPPPHVAVVAVHCTTIHEALLANLTALQNACSASELVDDFILKFTENNIEFAKTRAFIEGNPKAILMVEFFSETEGSLSDMCKKFIRDLNAQELGYAHPILRGAESQLAWNVRKAGLGLIRNIPGDARPVNLIEDGAVLPSDLPDYITDLESLLQKHKVQYSVYAHAGAGELHVEPIVNLKTTEGVKLFRQILADTAVLIKKYNGSLSGEHGDGRLRGEFIPFMMGDKVYILFKNVKQIFDPLSIFNKGKIVDTPPMDESLRYAIDKKPAPKKTFYDFSQVGGMLKLAEKCSGSGDCRKSEMSGGTMCPSFMATRSERDTTRARANILRQYLTEKPDFQVEAEQVKEILDLCLSCKGCKSECPSSVDIAKMKGEFLQTYYDKHGTPWRAKMIGNFTNLMKWASIAPVVYNTVVKLPFIRKSINRLTGFHPKRTLPTLGRQTLRAWYKHWERTHISSNKPKVVVFCDEFTNYNDVEIGKKLILMLEKLGYNPVIVQHPESGRSFMSKGMIRVAQKLANEQVRLFSEVIDENTPLIGIEPSAILSFRDEYIDLVAPDLKEKSKILAKHVYTFEEWFVKETLNSRIKKEQFSKTPQSIKLHVHCHQKALTPIAFSKTALEYPENYRVEIIPSGCCGMAGSFGYEKEHFDLSMQVGELVLFKKIRACASDEIIVATGTSCRHQIHDGVGKTAFHPIEILYEAIVV